MWSTVRQREKYSLVGECPQYRARIMVKKFVMLLTPFLLAPFGTLMTSSPVHAAYWTDWEKCVFSYAPSYDYTWWSARIQTRSDGAARPDRIMIGNGNSEEIITIQVWDSWDVASGRRRSRTHTESFWPTVREEETSTFALTWIAQRLPRYVNVQLFNFDGSRDGRTCKSEIKF
jgi:hypothetical protein